jgi:hypothetical protein
VEADVTGMVNVGLDADLYAEFILRTRRSVDVAGWVNRIVGEFLDRTRDDPKIWSPVAQPTNGVDTTEEEFHRQYGDPQRGYQWHPVFLPNGTQLRMVYRTKPHYAEIRHEKVIYEGEAALSPSELARKIARNTNRNAWRDLWVKLPNTATWVLSDTLRSKVPQVLHASLEELGL